ncbi:MAG TPA: flagellar basal body P-ring formation chaperone FlgA [Acetobacteraceae bacterium]|nr:flagellar basal body P-ring formation chaperone FlgA [Acetobacteraceae bacterium]
MERRELTRMTLLAFALWALAAAALAQPAPRPVALVEGETIRLADLFEGAGPRAEAALGAAPAPGRRIIIEAPQLAAIARMHGLAWRPLTGQERSIIERPGRPLAREEIFDTLRTELMRLGLDAEAEIEIPGFVAPLVPLQALPQIIIEAPHFDPLTQRFSATLAVIAEGTASQRLRLAGRAVATVPVVVATRRMAVGDIVQPADARLIRLRAERVRPGAAERLEQVVGQQLRRPTATELPFYLTDVAAPQLVARNALVTMVLDAPGLTLTAQGRALEAAARGAVVPVMNLASRAIVEAEVIGPGRVRVAMGAVPVAGR